MAPYAEQRHYDLESFNAVMTASPGDLDVALPAQSVEGRLPEDLLGGTWWGNGPGQVRIGRQLIHPFDGHGYVRALRLEPDRLRLQARFVRTQAYEEEREAGAVRFRGLGTRLEGGWRANLHERRPRNVANTCVLPWAGRVLALWEGGLPHALHPESLDTLGVEHFQGALSEGQAFLAHTRVLGDRLIGLLQQLQGMRTSLRFVEVDSTGRMLSSREATLEGMSLTHDFLATPHWYIALESAITVSPWDYLKARLGTGDIIHALRQRVRTGRALLVPRGSQGEPRMVDLGHPTFSVHHVNAWEDGGRVHLVTCAFEQVSFGHEFGYQGPSAPMDPGVRRPEQCQALVWLEVEPGSGTVTRRKMSPYAMDFPRVHPTREGQVSRYVYAATSSHTGLSDPFDSVARVDLEAQATEVWTAPAGCFVGEPLVAPRRNAQGEEEVWVLAMVYDGRAGRSWLSVLNGQKLAAGPVARIHLPVLLPYGFHGWWQAVA